MTSEPRAHKRAAGSQASRGLACKNKILTNTLLITKTSGKFSYAYKEDALVLSFLLKYKINENFRVGFPDTAFDKVINTLEEKKINYQIISKDSEPIVKDYGKLNKYQKVLKNAREFQNIVERVEMIKEKLADINDVERLDRIIEVIEDELQV